MGTPSSLGVQSQLNEVMPIKSWLNLEELNAVTHLKAREMFESADIIGTLHFARFVNFRDHNQIGLLTTFDGSFHDYMQDFLKHLGPVFNLLQKNVVNPCPTPIEKNVEAWIAQSAEYNLEGLAFYSAYPNLSVQDIRARFGVTRGGAKGVQSPLTLVLKTKSPTHLGTLSQLIAEATPKLHEAWDAIGTVHSSRFIPMGTTTVTYVSEYDGSLEKHIQDLSTHLGPILDRILENVADAPPTPVAKNTPALVDWITAHNLKPWAFYTAYPTLSVKEIRASASAAAAGKVR